MPAAVRCAVRDAGPAPAHPAPHPHEPGRIPQQSAPGGCRLLGAQQAPGCSVPRAHTPLLRCPAESEGAAGVLLPCCRPWTASCHWRTPWSSAWRSSTAPPQTFRPSCGRTHPRAASRRWVGGERVPCPAAAAAAAACCRHASPALPSVFGAYCLLTCGAKLGACLPGAGGAGAHPAAAEPRGCSVPHQVGSAGWVLMDECRWMGMPAAAPPVCN